MTVTLLKTEEQLENHLQQHSAFFVLKHSLTCPISAEAKREFERFSSSSDFPCYILPIQESRALSNEMADRFQVKHESPQALLIKKGQVIWHDSHYSITEKNLKNAAR
ncbi:bacillithiol system redox-active protein YtxJ [Halobacillus salinarum]|uniref:Bacillithiol system redox-active protein YtxJ n=1 Tax=Halobacillus salinarum TaxID=2932257 RepID=A0ABY4EP14_9BACI|nr:bacillithiol system redox-active protein YtxJ [Halobacillus salinarum]UOQ46125.1 bacillithiol system redox-active protein YtxJ [Halobacillus salinarum]